MGRDVETASITGRIGLAHVIDEDDDDVRRSRGGEGNSGSSEGEKKDEYTVDEASHGGGY
jgi:hypothetical protein